MDDRPDSPIDAQGIAKLPIGYQRFHRRKFINYQLNRAHGLGYADADELRQTVAGLRKRDQLVGAFDALSQRAGREGRLRNATSYLRIAEFFTPPGSNDKVPLYRRYRDLFDRAFSGEGLRRADVPYEGGFLPAYRLASNSSRPLGTVLVHGGFDSLIEEFHAIWARIAAAGFDVIAFDGPGQGGALALGGITFEHDWERPVGAILDHFEIESAALVGISMGGHWALRAAGRERRIAQVVSWSPVYDWLLQIPSAARPTVRFMLRRRNFMRWSIRVRTALIPTLRQVIDQVLYLVDSDDPVAAVDWFLAMNPDHLGSERVTQDVLVMYGEKDAFQRPAQATAQVAALTAARSVTVRRFTAAEHADQHCQMGNLGLACDVLTSWLTDTMTGGPRAEPSQPTP